MPTGLSARLIVLFCALLPARADVIYTNFGAGDPYSAGSGLIVTHDGAAWSSVAIAFIPPASYTLASIELVASNLFAGDRGSVLGLFADDNGRPGGKPLELFRLGELGQFGATLPILTLKSSLQPLLQVDTVYWIGLNAPRGSMIVWNQNSSSATGIASIDGAGHWSLSDSPQGALRINGDLAPTDPDPVIIAPLVIQTTQPSAPNTPPLVVVNQSEEIPAFVPEPATLWLLAVPLLTLLLARQNSSGLPHQKQ